MNFLRLAFGNILIGLVASTAAAQSPIVIGASTPLTGPVSHYGQHARWGAEMAVAEANAKGGVNGRKIEIDFQDNRCNPAEAVKSVTQMLSSKKYAAIFDGLCSSAALAIMPLVERAKVPFIVANASATSIAEKSGVGGNKWTFKVNPTDASMLDALVAWLDKEGKADNIAFLGEDTDYGRAGSAGFEAALKKRDQKLVMVDYFQKGTADFTPVLTKIKAKKPGMLALYAIDADFQNGIKQWFSHGRRHSAHRPRAGRPGAEGDPGERLPRRHDFGPALRRLGRHARQQGLRRGLHEEAQRSADADQLRVLRDDQHPDRRHPALRRCQPGSHPRCADDAPSTSRCWAPVLEFDKNNLIHNNAIIFGIKGGKVVILGMSKT